MNIQITKKDNQYELHAGSLCLEKNISTKQQAKIIRTFYIRKQMMELEDILVKELTDLKIV